MARWNSVNDQIHTFVADAWHSFTKEEQMFAVALREYVKVLAATTRALEVRQKWLWKESEGTASVPWDTYQLLENEYAKGISEYPPNRRGN